MRTKSTTFAEISAAGLEWSKQHKRDRKNDDLRIPRIVKAFSVRVADSIKPAEIDEYITANAKAPATQNRLRSLFSMIYREALRNEKVTSRIILIPSGSHCIQACAYRSSSPLNGPRSTSR